MAAIQDSYEQHWFKARKTVYLIRSSVVTHVQSQQLLRHTDYRLVVIALRGSKNEIISQQ